MMAKLTKELENNLARQAEVDSLLEVGLFIKDTGRASLRNLVTACPSCFVHHNGTREDS